MAFVPSKKGTLLIPSGSSGNPDQNHLHIIMTDECTDGLHLLVNISSIYDGVFHDPACVLPAGCHKFIVRDSYVVFDRASTRKSAHIVKCVDGWLYKPNGPVNDEIFDQIAAGVLSSRFISRGMKKYFMEQTGIQ